MYWGLFSEGKLKVETENLSSTNPNLRGDVGVIDCGFTGRRYEGIVTPGGSMLPHSPIEPQVFYSVTHVCVCVCVV